VIAEDAPGQARRVLVQDEITVMAELELLRGSS